MFPTFQMIRSTKLVTALLGLTSVWADLNVVTPDLNTVDVAEARDGQFVSILLQKYPC